MVTGYVAGEDEKRPVHEKDNEAFDDFDKVVACIFPSGLGE